MGLRAWKRGSSHSGYHMCDGGGGVWKEGDLGRRYFVILKGSLSLLSPLYPNSILQILSFILQEEHMRIVPEEEIKKSNLSLSPYF